MQADGFREFGSPFEGRLRLDPLVRAGRRQRDESSRDDQIAERVHALSARTIHLSDSSGADTRITLRIANPASVNSW